MPMRPSDPTEQERATLLGGVTPERPLRPRMVVRLSTGLTGNGGQPCGTPQCAQCRAAYGDMLDELLAMQRRQQRAHDEDAQRRHLLARVQARETLESLLSAENRRRLDDEQHILVTGSHGGVYRIEFGHSGNVIRYWTDAEGQRRRQRLCAHPTMVTPDGLLPSENAMIAQLLMITADEREFLRTANDYD